jgi:HAD superfamily hydrolase (TIGR01509 family)
MAIKAIIFDFGGVLVRTHDPSGRRKWEKLLHLPLGGLDVLVFDSEISVQATVGKLKEADVWKYVGSSLKLSPDQLEELREDFWRGDQLDLELVSFLRSLRPAYKTAILSNAWSNARQVFEEKYLLRDAVDHLIISAEVNLAKPGSQIYILAANILDVSPAEAVFVDDVDQNVQAAIAVGMVGIMAMRISPSGFVFSERLFFLCLAIIPRPQVYSMINWCLYC